MTDSVDNQQTGGLPGPDINQQINIKPGGAGQLATVTAPSGMLMSSEASKGILDNMQKMLDEYESPMNKFNKAMQAAHAWTVYNKTPAFMEINRQEEQDRANKYNIAQSMAALKGNQIATQNIAKSLLSTGAGGNSHQFAGIDANGNPTGDKIIDDLTQGAIDKMIMNEGNLAGAQALRKKAYDTYVDKSMNNRFNVDWDAPVPDVLMPDGTTKTVTRRVLSNMMNSDPVTAQFLKNNNPNLAQKVGDSSNKTPLALRSPKDLAAEIEKDFGIKLGPDALERSRDAQQNLINRAAQGDKSVYMPEPLVEGKDTYHVGAIDVPKNVPESYINARGYERKLGSQDPVHATQIPGWGQQQQPTAVPAPGPAAPGAPMPKSATEANEMVKRDTQFQETWMKKNYEPLADRVNAQKNDITMSNQILGSLEKDGKYGPGADIDQAISKGLQTLGFKGSEEEQRKYLSNMTINQARDLLATSAMRSALGAQFTENENKAFKDMLPSINSPVEAIKYYYQLRIASAKADEAELRYIDQHRKNPIDAADAWRASGERERILRENAPIYAKIAAKAEGKTPAAAKTVVKTGMVTDKNHPDYGKKVTVYSDGTRDVK